MTQVGFGLPKKTVMGAPTFGAPHHVGRVWFTQKNSDGGPDLRSAPPRG